MEREDKSKVTREGLKMHRTKKSHESNGQRNKDDFQEANDQKRLNKTYYIQAE